MRVTAGRRGTSRSQGVGLYIAALGAGKLAASTSPLRKHADPVDPSRKYPEEVYCICWLLATCFASNDGLLFTTTFYK